MLKPWTQCTQGPSPPDRPRALEPDPDITGVLDRGPGRALRPAPRPPGAYLAYIASIAASYFALIGLRLSFIVGVSSSPPGSQSRSTIVNFLICSTRASVSLARVDALLHRRDHGRPRRASASSEVSSMPCCAAQAGAKSASSTISAVL